MDERRVGARPLAVVERVGILESLAQFDPIVVGTFPLGLDRAGSDVDILCWAEDLDMFLARAHDLFEDFSRFRAFERVADDRQPEAVVVSFVVEGVPVELFGQAVPTRHQQAYRHFSVERRLLDLGGDELADQVRLRRRPGESVEVAFAEVLGLPGDPYAAVLDLEGEADASLVARIRAALA